MVYEAVHVTAGGQAAIKFCVPKRRDVRDITARFFNEEPPTRFSTPHHRACSTAATRRMVWHFWLWVPRRHEPARTTERTATPGESLRIARPDCFGVTCCPPATGRPHRDIKPDNIMWCRIQISPERDDQEQTGVSRSRIALGPSLPDAKRDPLMGTPTYMARSNAEGKHVHR